MKNRKKQDNAAAQSAIYIGFVDTPGLFASIIRRVIGQNYVHVVLGFDYGMIWKKQKNRCGMG